MYILLLMALVFIGLSLTTPQYGLRQNNNKNYFIICGTLLALVMGLRHRYAGSPDTWSYSLMFENMIEYDSFWDFYDFHLDESSFLFSESGFYFCTWLLTRVFQNAQILIFITSVFITFSTCLFIRRNSTDSSFSFILYVCLGLFTFNMNGMRQAMAMSICLFAFEHAKKHQLLRYLLVILLAMQFHKSAIFFLPVFFMPFFKNTKANWLVFFIAMVGFVFFADRLIPLFNDVTGKEYTSENAADSGGILVVMIYLSGIALTFICPQSLEKPIAKMSLLGSIVGLASYLTRYIYNDIMERLSYYYFYFLLLLIPEVINELSDEEKKISKVLFIIFSLLLFAYRLFKGSFRNFTFFFN